MEVPEFLQGNFPSQYDATKQNNDVGGGDNSNNFIVEDLLDFSNEDDAPVITDGTFDSSVTEISSTVTNVVNDNSISSSFSTCEPNFGCRSLADVNFSSDICLPYDVLPELEWLSNFVEESFSSNDLQKLHQLSEVKVRPDEPPEAQDFKPDLDNKNANIVAIHSHDIKVNNVDLPPNNNPIFNSDVSVPAKARSKRSRATTGNWASCLLVPNPPTSSHEKNNMEIQVVPPQPSFGKKVQRKNASEGGAGDGRRCWHCATDKTPQWRTGPNGPKTLCNACGVRYKSGRLMPEYRPAASPTFIMTKHSNSHRKVLELRRQNEMQKGQPQNHHHHHHHHQQPMFMHHHHHHHQNIVFDVSNGDDYLIHQHVGPDFRQLI
ncbi:hypothetical protein ACFE04_011570 [Oxalis oulophora]